MVDREKRDLLAEYINRFLNCEISAFDFDDKIFAIKSEDKTIDWIIHSLWGFYDDCLDHNADLSKDAWDYIQRLLLILKSDSEILEVAKKRELKAGTCVLLSFVIIIACILYFSGLDNIWLYVIWAAGAVISFLVYWQYIKKSHIEINPVTYPFSSYYQIASLKRITGLKKMLFRVPKSPGKLLNLWIAINTQSMIYYSVSIAIICLVFWPIGVVISLFKKDYDINVVIAPENIPQENIIKQG